MSVTTISLYGTAEVFWSPGNGFVSDRGQTFVGAGEVLRLRDGDEGYLESTLDPAAQYADPEIAVLFPLWALPDGATLQDLSVTYQARITGAVVPRQSTLRVRALNTDLLGGATNTYVRDHADEDWADFTVTAFDTTDPTNTLSAEQGLAALASGLFMVGIDGAANTTSAVDVSLVRLDITMDLPITPFTRSHLYLPLTLPNGNLLPFADVTFVDPYDGTPAAAPIYRSSDDSALAEAMPVTFAPGIVDVWCDGPARFDLQVAGPNGYSVVVPAVDLPPDPSAVARGQNAMALADEGAEAEQVLLSDGTRQYWGYVVQIPPHQHDGSQSGSTRLDLGQGVADASPNQTWVGAGSGAAPADGTSSSALGADAEPLAGWVTVLGQAAAADAGGDRSVALGQASYTAADSVSMGEGSGQAIAQSVSLTPDADGYLRFYSTPATTTLRNLTLSQQVNTVGSAPPPPGTSYGAGNPFVLYGDPTIEGSAHLSNDVSLAGVDHVLSVYGADGATQPSAPTAGTTNPALLSLVAALQAYGLIGTT